MAATCVIGVAIGIGRRPEAPPPRSGIGAPGRSTVTEPVGGPQGVVFYGAAGGRWGTWVVSPVTGASELLYETNAESVLASPDGLRLAELEGDRVRIRDARTAKPLSRPRISTVGFSWSADGKWVSGYGAVAAADGSSLRRVARAPSNGSLSPNGRHLAYESRRGLWVAAVDGSWRRRITPAEMTDAARPRWSPRGDLIAFVRRGDVYVVSPHGTGLGRIGRDWSYESEGGETRALANMSWSPDGRELAYVSARDGGEHVYVVDVATGRERRLTRGEESFEPAWSPDGRRIAFTRRRPFTDDKTGVFVVMRDGGGLRDLTAGYSYAREPSWRVGDVTGVVPAPVRQVSLRPVTTLEHSDAVGGLANDGTLVAILPPEDDWHERCGQIPVWSVETRRVQRVRAVRTCVDNYGVEIALGGGWLFALSGYLPPFQQGATETELTATRLAVPKLEVVAREWWTEEDAGWEITAVDADAAAAVYSVDSASLDDRSPFTIRRWDDGEERAVAEAQTAGVVVDIDTAGRVLVRRRDGHLLLGRDGSVIARIPSIGDARLGDRRVVTLGRGVLTVWHSETGRSLKQTRIAGAKEPAQLADADDAFAAVVLRGRLRLIRLDDGKQVEIQTPPGRPTAAVEPEGLFHASGSTIAFVSRHELERALR